MRWTVIIFIFIILIFIQLSFPPSELFKFFVPNLILIFLASSVFYLNFKEIIFCALLAGFFLDMASLLLFGTFLIIYLILGSVFYLFRGIFHGAYFYSTLIFTGGGTILFYFLLTFFLIILSFLGDKMFPLNTLKHLLFVIAPTSLLTNLVVVLPLSLLIKKVFSWLSYYKGGSPE